jgi:hypothetical protein
MNAPLSELSYSIAIDENGAFHCFCGNEPESQGAYLCDKDGNYIEDSGEEYPGQLYRCDRCGTIFEVDTGIIRGRFP